MPFKNYKIHFNKHDFSTNFIEEKNLTKLCLTVHSAAPSAF